MMNFRLKNKFISVGLSFMFCSVCLGFPKNFVQNGFSSYSASVFAGNVPADKVAPVDDIRGGVGDFFDQFSKYVDLMDSDFDSSYISTVFPDTEALVGAGLEQKFVLEKLAPIRDFLLNFDNLYDVMDTEGYVDAYQKAGNKKTYVDDLIKVGDDSTKLAKDIYNTKAGSTGAVLKGVDNHYDSAKAQAIVSGEALDGVLKTLQTDDELKKVTEDATKTKDSMDYKSLVKTLTGLKKINFVILVEDVNKVVDLFDANTQTDSKVEKWFDGKFDAAALTALLADLKKSENDKEILGENCVTYVTNTIKKIIDLYVKDVNDVLTAKGGDIAGGIVSKVTDFGFFDFAITEGNAIAESFDRVFSDRGEEGKNLSILDLKLVPYLVAVLEFFAHCLDIQKKALDAHYATLTGMDAKTVKMDVGDYGTKMGDTTNAFTVFCKNVYDIVQALKLLLKEPKKLASTTLEVEGDPTLLCKPIPLKSSLDETITGFVDKLGNDAHVKDKAGVPDDLKNAVKKVEDAVKALNEDLEKKSVLITTLLSNSLGCGLIMKNADSFVKLLIKPLATLTEVVGKKGNADVGDVVKAFANDEAFKLKRAVVKDALNEFSKFRKPLARLVSYSNVVGSDAEKGKEALAANPILRLYNKCSLILGNITTNSAAAFALDMVFTTGLYQANPGVEKMADMAGYMPGGVPKKEAPGKGYSRRRK